MFLFYMQFFKRYNW